MRVLKGKGAFSARLLSSAPQARGIYMRGLSEKRKKGAQRRIMFN